jgi:hypothetical protein
MVGKTPPLKPRPLPVTPSPGEGANGEERRPARTQQHLDKDEVNRLVGELIAELASDDKTTVATTRRLCRALSQCAAARLGLIITGRQAASSAQIVTSSVAIMKGAGVLGTGDAESAAEFVAE